MQLHALTEVTKQPNSLPGLGTHVALLRTPPTHSAAGVAHAHRLLPSPFAEPDLEVWLCG